MRTLLDFVAVLAELLAARPAPDPVLVHVVREGDDFVVGVLPVDSHPVDALLGQDADPTWQALGVVARATVRAGPTAGRGTTSVFVTATGDVVGRVRCDSGDVLTDPPEEGLVLDALRRAYGLATPPPEHDAAAWDELLTEARKGGMAHLGIPAWLAEWFDVGSFSRFAIGHCGGAAA